MHGGGQRSSQATWVSSQSAPGRRSVPNILTPSEIHRLVRGFLSDWEVNRSPMLIYNSGRRLFSLAHSSGRAGQEALGEQTAFGARALAEALLALPVPFAEHGGIVQGSVHNPSLSTHRDSEANRTNILMFFFFSSASATAAAAAAKALAHIFPVSSKCPLGDPELSCNAQ